MSVQRLGDRKTRALARTTGLDIIRAWTTGQSQVVQFVTRDHQHGTHCRRDGMTTMFAAEGSVCFDTCRMIDPAEPSGYREGTT